MKVRVLSFSLVATLFAGSAQASSVVGNVVGAVVISAIGSVMTHKKEAKLGSCTLYDREGNPVVVSCPADVAAAGAKTTLAVAPPPTPVHAAPLPDLGQGRVVSVVPEPRGPDRCISCEVLAPPPAVFHQPPPRPYAPPQLAGGPLHDCDCEQDTRQTYRQEYRDETVYRPRSVASFLSVEGGHTEVTYSRPRVVAVYDSYERSSQQISGYYESGYAGGYGAAYGYAGGGGYAYGAGGVGQGPQIHPYGGVGYGAGGYAEPRGRPRVAGRDPNGFLTWPGKR